jgi:hypothetical protein
MLLAIVAVGAGAVAGLALGGRLSNVGSPPLKSLWLLLAGAVCAFVASRLQNGSAGLAVEIAGYLLLLGFAARNFRLTGMVLVTVGLLANLTVIALDSGMPVKGFPPGASLGSNHHGEQSGDRLTGLADVVSLQPVWNKTVSGGDIVLALGTATLTFGLLRPPRRPSALQRR